MRINSSPAAATAKSLQLCPTVWPHRRQPTSSAVPGILQARILEWAAIAFSNAWKRKVKVKSLSHVWLLATPWTAAHQAPPSMGFSRQEYWSGLPLPSPIQTLKHITVSEDLSVNCLLQIVSLIWSFTSVRFDLKTRHVSPFVPLSSVSIIFKQHWWLGKFLILMCKMN